MLSPRINFRFLQRAFSLIAAASLLGCGKAFQDPAATYNAAGQIFSDPLSFQGSGIQSVKLVPDKTSTKARVFSGAVGVEEARKYFNENTATVPPHVKVWDDWGKIVIKVQSEEVVYRVQLSWSGEYLKVLLPQSDGGTSVMFVRANDWFPR